MKLQLNIAQIRLDALEVELFTRPLNVDDRMGAIRAQLPAGWDAHSESGKIYAWRYAGAEPAPKAPWEATKISIKDNALIFLHLLVGGTTRYLEATGFESIKRRIPVLARTTTNLLDDKLTTPIDRRVAIHPVYTLEGLLKGNPGVAPDLMLTIGSRTQWRLTIPISELNAKGLVCTGLGVRLGRTGLPGEFEHVAGKVVGTVKRVDGDNVELDDPYDPKLFRVPANLVWPEGSRHALKRYVDFAHAPINAQLWAEVLKVDEEQSKPKNLLKRVGALTKHLAQAPIALADGLNAQVTGLLPPNSSVFPIADLKPTNYVFDYASKTKDDIAARGLRRNGPYDKAHSPLKHSRILILCPNTYEVAARKFFKKFQDGCLHPNRDKGYYDFAGFGKVYRLAPISYVEEYFDPIEGGSIGKACETTLKRVLQKSKDYDLCFALTEDQHKALEPVDDPYCIAKGMLLAHGVPVSELTAEDISKDDGQLVFVLSNVALQGYAKMGGVPFVLEAPKEDKLELILGVGRADIGSSRFGKKRVVGFATVFKNNGDYLVGAVRPFKDAEDYADEFAQVITDGLNEAIQREGLKEGMPIRLIFHIYKKPGEGKEIRAIQNVLKEHTKHLLEYAFVNVSDTHPHIIVDEHNGDGIPPRRKIIKLSKRTNLITLIGPGEYLRRGTPVPLKVSLDKRSTYQDIDRLTQQVYDFANVTWRGFNIAVRPVTIHYAQLAAALAGKLQQTPHWNNTMMETLLRDKRWFL